MSKNIFSDWLIGKSFTHKGFTYKHGVNDNSASIILAQASIDIINNLPKMDDAVKNADTHFTSDYEDLNDDYQHEHEGLMWGWQDCCKKIKESLNKQP